MSAHLCASVITTTAAISAQPWSDHGAQPDVFHSKHNLVPQRRGERRVTTTTAAGSLELLGSKTQRSSNIPTGDGDRGGRRRSASVHGLAT